MSKVTNSEQQMSIDEMMADESQLASSESLPISTERWKQVTLGDLGIWGSGGTPKSNEESYYNGEIPWIRSGDLPDGSIIKHYENISDTGLQNSAAKWIPEDTVLIALYGATIGKLGKTTYPVTTNQAVAYCIPNLSLTTPDFLFWYLLYLRPELIALGQGGAQPNISQAILKRYSILLPPLDEQRRIVATLDRLFARSKHAREELERVPRLVERMKQAVLEQAFSGELTADLRESQGEREDGPWAIPKDWQWGKIADVAEIVSNLVAPSEVLDLPHIAPNHIETGVPHLLPFKTVREDGVISAKHRFSPGLIIYSKIRPYLRKSVLVDFEGVCSADMYPIRAKYDPKYLLYWLISPDFSDLTMEHQGRTVLPKINQNALYKIDTPIPPQSEQQEIAFRIEAAFARIDTMAAEAARATALLDRLEQATLAKAFRGELVTE